MPCTGGTWLDRAQLGQSFFGNFFCDLTQPVSLSGVANPVGSRLAQCGMLCFCRSPRRTILGAAEHFAPGNRAQRWVRGMGTLSVLTFMLSRHASSISEFARRLALLSGLWG